MVGGGFGGRGFDEGLTGLGAQAMGLGALALEGSPSGRRADCEVSRAGDV